LFNVDDGTITFLENVLDDVMALFPSRYIHLGGDESVKDQWQQSPAVQARLQAGPEGRKAAAELVHGSPRAVPAGARPALIGWDEILEGGPPADATVMSWRGTQGAIEAARAAHDVVLAPAPDLYFDHVQSDRGDETPGRLGVIDSRACMHSTRAQGTDAGAAEPCAGCAGEPVDRTPAHE
jgi:hexosaminidase